MSLGWVVMPVVSGEGGSFAFVVVAWVQKKRLSFSSSSVEST
jgi:hypothetical protein